MSTLQEIISQYGYLVVVTFIHVSLVAVQLYSVIYGDRALRQRVERELGLQVGTLRDLNKALGTPLLLEHTVLFESYSIWDHVVRVDEHLSESPDYIQLTTKAVVDLGFGISITGEDVTGVKRVDWNIDAEGQRGASRARALKLAQERLDLLAKTGRVRTTR